jgi:endonuclease YncB( thermonuclease family)
VASVIDGDTIEIRGTRIRLHGIDAPKPSGMYTTRWHALAMRSKLAAILAADVVGYSRLMGRDESGTLARTRLPFGSNQFDQRIGA